jgi:O-methyltransferase domain
VLPEVSNSVKRSVRLPSQKTKPSATWVGATGLLLTLVAKRHPHMKCISFDLPAVEPIARKTIARESLSDRIQTAAGDFFRDSLPKADVVTMGMILHDWNLEKKKHLIRAAYNALPQKRRVHRRGEYHR